MTDATQPGGAGADWRDCAFDLTRGIAAYCGSALVRGLARVVAKHPDADISNAFNHKQVACKVWARDRLFDSLGGSFAHIVILGGWYGVLAAMLLEDRRFAIGSVESIDIDPGGGSGCEHPQQGGRRSFPGDHGRHVCDRLCGPRAPTSSSTPAASTLPICGAWLGLLPKGANVLLQSNDYFSEPTHINCVESAEAFARLAGLAERRFSGTLPMKNYNRFMLIGTV